MKGWVGWLVADGLPTSGHPSAACRVQDSESMLAKDWRSTTGPRMSMSHQSKRLKKSSSDWLTSGNAPIQWVKNAIFVFPVLPCSAEAQVILGGVVKRLLIAYFTGSICAKKYQNPFTRVQSYTKPKVGRCLRHGVYMWKTNETP